MRNNPDDLSNQLINQIKKWLKHEIKHQQPSWMEKKFLLMELRASVRADMNVLKVY